MKTTSAAFVVAALVIAGGTAAVASWPASATPSGQVIRLTPSGGGDHNIDLGRDGFSVGDMQVTSAPVSSAGRHAGRFVGACQAMKVSKHAERQLCTWVFDLRSGSISTSGSVTAGRTGPAPFDFAITGGTGDYTGAQGYVHIEPANRRPVFEVHLQP
jgi:hypothetical protein